MHQPARAMIMSSLLHCIHVFFFAFSFAQTLGGILYLYPSKRAVWLHLSPTSSLLSLSWARTVSWAGSCVMDDEGEIECRVSFWIDIGG